MPASPVSVSRLCRHRCKIAGIIAAGYHVQLSHGFWGPKPQFLHLCDKRLAYGIIFLALKMWFFIKSQQVHITVIVLGVEAHV